MKFNKDWLKYKWVGNAIAICCGVVLFVLLENLGSVFGVVGRFFRFMTPVVIGIAIAYIIDPLARIFEHHLFGKMKRWQLRRMLAVILALILVLVLVVTLMVYLVPQLIDSIKQFIDNMDGYVRSLKDYVRNLSQKFPSMPINADKINDFLDNLSGNVVRWLGDNREIIIDKGISFGSGLITFLLGLILAIYFLFGKYFMIAGGKRFLRAAMPQNKYRSTMSFFGRCNRIMTRYVAFDVLDGLIIGVVNGIFMAIMDMPYAVLISVVVGVTNLAPTFGPLVGAVIGGLILLLVNPVYALIFIIFTLILQTIDGYVLKPKLFGDSLGVSSVVILVFIILGGRMFGIMGVLLSIPCAAIVDFSYHDFILHRMERKRGILDGKEETPEAESNKALLAENERSKIKDEIKEVKKQERKQYWEDKKDEWEDRREERREEKERRKEERERRELLESREAMKGTRKKEPDDKRTLKKDSAENNTSDSNSSKNNTSENNASQSNVSKKEVISETEKLRRHKKNDKQDLPE